MSRASDDIGYAGRGLAYGTVAAEFVCSIGEYHSGNLAEASKYATLGVWFGLPLFFDGLMRIGATYRKRTE
jgi:hypothetical protein